MSTHNTESLSLSGRSAQKTQKTGLKLTTIFEVLSNPRRILLLDALSRAGGEMAFRELVDDVASAEYGRSMDEISSDERHTIYVSLYQTHIPKLGELGVLEFDRPSGVIRSGVHSRAVERHLELHTAGSAVAMPIDQ